MRPRSEGDEASTYSVSEEEEIVVKKKYAPPRESEILRD